MLCGSGGGEIYPATSYDLEGSLNIMLMALGGKVNWEEVR